ncbi:MAG: C-GCAxxG-C-C family protein [Melioribacteraceae bacterium]|nr:C-GCAxxG-C-C family protein [Melioribacteraceae bacterium]MCF8353386.1 C-GCAxxG-C-C family protein [Melioribacteraceae bacterium]MCF8393035.1 C-GCAxxG-C-C family protein [Melioribacteraceae bacterium]MCF8419112.1 C-GCAxxG-C-C family protein [Melioribacteraceae bacterium]
MNKTEESVYLFNKNYNCAQSVLTAFGEELGIAKEKAIRMASPFGGGMAMHGEVCGAVTGALMVIGARFGCANTEPVNNSLPTNIASEFMAEFENRNGSCLCKELIGYRLYIPAEKEMAESEGVFINKCPHFIEDAVVILEKYLINN